MPEFLSPIRSFLELGGPVVSILLALSVVALALTGLKVVTFISHRVGKHSNAKRAIHLWHSGQKAKAKESLETSKSALDRTLYIGMSQAVSGKKFKGDLDEEMSAVAMRDLHELRRGFRALEAIAQIAPLLGLFGTVIGMIDAFQKLQSAGNSVDPSILAGGIWVALLTTAAGLAVAMPVSLVLTYFETRVDDESIAIQTMTSVLFSDQISNDEPSAQSDKSTLELGYAT